MSTSQPNRLALALEYVARGWAVFPLFHIAEGKCSCNGRKNCRPGKHPLTHHGWKDASTDPAQVRAWWRDSPLANIGIATGVVSSLVVLDIDSEDARRVLDAAMASLGVTLPETWTVRTGDGWHHYFTVPSGLVVPSHNPIYPISLQGDKAYVVGVGSIHKTGRVYSWEHHLDDRTLAAAPDWLLADDWRREVGRSAKRLGLESLCEPRKGAPPCGAFRSEKVVEGNCSVPPCGTLELRNRSTPNPTCEDHEDHEDHENREDHVWLGETPEALIDHVKLTGPGQTDKRVEQLIRGLKLDLGLSLADGLKWVKRWHTLNAKHITDEHEWWTMEEKAQRGWKTFRIPLRSDAAVRAEQLARVGPSLPEVGRYSGRVSVQRAIGICAYVQAFAPGIAFFLSTRQLARALGHQQNDTAFKILRGLESDGLMQCVHRGTQGNNGLAAKWLYLGTLPVLGCMRETNPKDSDK
jgi:hypothetical protein